MPQDLQVAIHQPNFFPWMGYFNKRYRADIFIYLDSAQFPKTGGCWVNRVKLLAPEPLWCTVPVERNYHGVKRISEIEINESTDWRGKFIKTLTSQYGRAPHFDAVMAVLEPLVRQPKTHLADYNMHAIDHLATRLGITQPKIVRSSSLRASGEATDWLIALVKEVGGTTYLSGDGAESYQEQDKYAKAGLRLVFQNFRPPEYPQIHRQAFAPGLSIIDCLMNCGFDSAAALLKGQA